MGPRVGRCWQARLRPGRLCPRNTEQTRQSEAPGLNRGMGYAGGADTRAQPCDWAVQAGSSLHELCSQLNEATPALQAPRGPAAPRGSDKQQDVARPSPSHVARLFPVGVTWCLSKARPSGPSATLAMQTCSRCKHHVLQNVIVGQERMRQTSRTQTSLLLQAASGESGRNPASESRPAPPSRPGTLPPGKTPCSPAPSCPSRTQFLLPCDP